MSIEENKALVHQFVEAFWNNGDLAVADDLIASDAIVVLPGIGQVGREGLKAFARTFRDAFPNWHSTAEELVGEADRVAERWTGRGTQQGEFQGIAATGKKVEVPGIVLYRIASGKIVEFWGQFDGLLLMQQLGAIPNHA